MKAETGIWRYMDVARFLSLIYTKGLYFARLHQLEDPREGSRSERDPIFRSDPEYAGRVAQKFNHRALVSCWHENEVESVAMWKLYTSGQEGVAIKTTVARLGALTKANRQVRIGAVAYGNPAQDTEIVKFEYGRCVGSEVVRLGERALFRKDEGYEHEREIRALIYDDYCVDSASWAAAGDAIGIGRADAVFGESVPTDLAGLIERIVVSPDFPAWAIGTLQVIVDSAGIPATVEPSGLVCRPSKRPRLDGG